MNSDYLTFSSKIDVEIEELFFDLLAQHLSDADYEEVYVTNVMVAPAELLFFAKIDGTESIIRIRL